MATGGVSGQWWDVNSGVFLVDLADEAARDLMLMWHTDFMATSGGGVAILPELVGQRYRQRPAAIARIAAAKGFLPQSARRR